MWGMPINLQLAVPDMLGPNSKLSSLQGSQARRSCRAASCKAAVIARQSPGLSCSRRCNGTPGIMHGKARNQVAVDSSVPCKLRKKDARGV